jgi:hypothetical protein
MRGGATALVASRSPRPKKELKKHCSTVLACSSRQTSPALPANHINHQHVCLVQVSRSVSARSAWGRSSLFRVSCRPSSSKASSSGTFQRCCCTSCWKTSAVFWSFGFAAAAAAAAARPAARGYRGRLRLRIPLRLKDTQAASSAAPPAARPGPRPERLRSGRE